MFRPALQARNRPEFGAGFEVERTKAAPSVLLKAAFSAVGVARSEGDEHLQPASAPFVASERLAVGGKSGGEAA